MRGRSDLVEVNGQYLLCQARDKRVTSVKILSFPSPTNTGKNVKSHPDIFQRHLMRNAIAMRHVPIENDHGSDVKGNRRYEERDVGELDQLIMKYDDVM